MFALVDCNAFYTNCEAIFNPALRGRPIVVLSNNDGCIVARNTEAQALNIPELLPYFQVRPLLEKHGVHVFSSNYELYGDISARVMRVLEDFASELEVYSIDEAFLRLPPRDLQARGRDIRETLWQHLRVPACVGMAPTKTLAKLANRAAKKIPKLNGVCVLDNEEKRRWLLARTPVEAVWGIGRRLSRHLHGFNIHSAQDLTEADATWLRRRFSIVLEKTLRELHGEPCLDLELEPAPKRDIISTRSFSYRVTALHELQQAISLYAARACEKLRRQQGIVQRLWIYAESGRRNEAHFYRQRLVTLPYETDDTRMVARYAKTAMAALYRPGIRFKKCGIGLLDVRTRRYSQGDLFAERQNLRSQQLMALMDRVNQRYGHQRLMVANTGIRPGWTMRRDFKSPAYTTRWADIPQVRC